MTARSRQQATTDPEKGKIMHEPKSWTLRGQGLLVAGHV
jgi:hypothetical protein